MNQHPILFSTEMVKAILDGRKTQTRRVMKPQPETDTPRLTGWSWEHASGKGIANGPRAAAGGEVQYMGASIARYCPYGQPGDLLWVRETFMEHHGENKVWYKASQNEQFLALLNEFGEKWRPSIHMPRWASRITLEVTGVRVERVQDISNEDILNEGIHAGSPTELNKYAPELISRAEFQTLWDKINAKRGYSWESNPWVWVVSFKQVSQ